MFLSGIPLPDGSAAQVASTQLGKSEETSTIGDDAFARATGFDAQPAPATNWQPQDQKPILTAPITSFENVERALVFDGSLDAVPAKALSLIHI